MPTFAARPAQPCGKLAAVTPIEQCPCCAEPIGRYGCACLRSEAQRGLRHPTVQVDGHPDTLPDADPAERDRR